MPLSLPALVVIPTYNECLNIACLLRALLALRLDLAVLVVDDHSPDGTGDEVAKLQSQYKPRLHLLRRSYKEGLGRAYVAGFTWALDRGYAYIVSMDGDFSHRPTDLPKLLFRCVHHKIDMVIGSRYIAGGAILHWPRKRIWLSYTANWIAKQITGLPIQDLTAGFVCYRGPLLEKLLVHPTLSSSYAFQVEMKFLAHRYDASMEELPITFVNRTHGVSKMNLAIVIKSFLDIIHMKGKYRVAAS